ncbi:hypothetical protein [Tritonibacter scottomollicae]|uniref:Pentapeptide repeat protein n=1 Tax=Tritonibacter scottomollicae TaxID=483013 RepID=A0A2T1AP18_TRISK|nr:hypothetical protein [Tritonibacter scottomollicae]PRZ50355.1 hypothetical protein CLV89_101575 [Tritonibacter scottomollicae]
MHFKTWDDIAPPPNAAEQKLKAAAEAGYFCKLGPHDQIPEDPEDWQNLTEAQEARHIRAEVLRLILLNSDSCDTTEEGVMMNGAYISGVLDLTNCTIPGNLLLGGCRFQGQVFAPRSKWASNLRLRTCALPALSAMTAELRGQLTCEGANFNSPKGEAINLQGAKVKEDLFLRSATFNGSADFNGIKIGGQLDCEGAKFNTPKGEAINLQAAEITGGLFLRNIAQIRGALDLHAAKTSTLVDDLHSYPPTGELILDGFTYDRIIGPTDAKTRLDWLAKGDRWNGEFFPQPYKQLAKTLHDMGHESDAQQVRITLACKLRQDARAKLHITPDGDLGTGLHSIWHDICRLTLGAKDSISLLLTAHGYKPQRSLYALILLIAAATFPAQRAWDAGSFAPNSAPILLSESWQALARDDSIQNPAAEWTNRYAIPGKDWETFHPLAYAADVVIPIVEFGQTDAWAPSTERGTWGYRLWYWRWIFTTLGWIVTALGAAALTGIIRRD